MYKTSYKYLHFFKIYFSGGGPPPSPAPFKKGGEKSPPPLPHPPREPAPVAIPSRGVARIMRDNLLRCF